MKLERYNPSGPCRVSKGLPKALYVKRAVPSMVRMTRTVQKRMTLMWMLAGITWSKSGKTKEDTKIRRRCVSGSR